MIYKKEAEPIIEDMNFKIHKFTNRPKPTDNKRIAIFPLFSEFGCEILGTLYCLPRLLQTKYRGRYSIVMGWYGRDYLYKHLVDEFWEIDEKNQWLRDYCKAFHHESINLKHAQKLASQQGQVVDINEISSVAVFPMMEKCMVEKDGTKCDGLIKMVDGYQVCSKCNGMYPSPGIFSRMQTAKQEAVWLPRPSIEKLEYVKKYIPPNPVGICARMRKTYGRNLEPIFYERLIFLLEDMGYNPVWIGEKATTLPCPFPRIPDFSRTEDARDLETTLALVSQLKFTIQYWTASSRLAALMDIPYIIFESPDQIYGIGQEGIRLNLCTKTDKRKIVLCHFKSVASNHSQGLKLVEQAIKELEDNNYNDIVGLVENANFINYMRVMNNNRIGNF